MARATYPQDRFHVTTAGGVTTVTPSGAMALRWLGLFAAVAVFCWAVAGWVGVSQAGNPLVGWYEGFVAGLGGVLALYGWLTWRRRACPLTVGPDRVVRYGRRTWCAAGRVQAVGLVREVSSGEGGDTVSYDLHLRTARGRVHLPLPFFRVVADESEARQVAEALAASLGVRVEEFG